MSLRCVNRDFTEKPDMRGVFRPAFIAAENINACNRPAMTVPVTLIRSAKIGLNSNI